MFHIFHSKKIQEKIFQNNTEGITDKLKEKPKMIIKYL
jgi:hypothetical protein